MKRKENTPPEKSYKNLEFLTSPEARSIRILSEYYEPMAKLKKNNIENTIVFFGSARIVSKRDARKNLAEVKKLEGKRNYKAKLAEAEKSLEMSQYYEDTVELSKKLTLWTQSLENKNQFVVCSGGGPGIMEAANKGAKLAKGKSIGLNISIPFEQFVNQYVEPELAFEFHYFFMRKFWFTYHAKVLMAFPGGFGTLDELMELLTLVQTKKLTKKLKILVYGKEFWEKVLNFDALIEAGMISKEDLKLFDVVSSVDEAYEKITQHLADNFRK